MLHMRQPVEPNLAGPPAGEDATLAAHVRGTIRRHRASVRVGAPGIIGREVEQHSQTAFRIDQGCYGFD